MRESADSTGVAVSCLALLAGGIVPVGAVYLYPE